MPYSTYWKILSFFLVLIFSLKLKPHLLSFFPSYVLFCFLPMAGCWKTGYSGGWSFFIKTSETIYQIKYSLLSKQLLGSLPATHKTQASIFILSRGSWSWFCCCCCKVTCRAVIYVRTPSAPHPHPQPWMVKSDNYQHIAQHLLHQGSVHDEVCNASHVDEKKILGE